MNATTGPDTVTSAPPATGPRITAALVRLFAVPKTRPVYASGVRFCSIAEKGTKTKPAPAPARRKAENRVI
ncbi:hypothetical protein D3C73_1181530 [compost metagenome]